MPYKIEIYIPKKEYIPAEEDIFADGWTVEKFFTDMHDDHGVLDIPYSPVCGQTEEYRNKMNAIIQERWKRATGKYWQNNKYAREKV